jgi:hypothetical protein
MQVGLGSMWDKDSVVDCFNVFFTNPSLKKFHLLPISISWGLWLARNALLDSFKMKF